MFSVKRRLGVTFFDRAFYLRRYPDVREAGVDPLAHYLEHGRAERRYPSRMAERLSRLWGRCFAWILATFFLNKAFYLRAYPDVARSGFAPRLHFRLFGYAEGRRWRAPAGFWARLAFISYFSTAQRAAACMTEEQLAYERLVVFGAATRGARRWLAVWAISSKRVGARHGRRSIAALYKVTPPDRVRGRCQLRHIAPAGSMRFSEPRVLGKAHSAVERTVAVPAKWICTAKAATVIGGFQVLLGDKFLLYEPAAHPNKGFVAGIWQYVAAIRGTKNRVVVKYDYKDSRHLDAGILLSGRCGENYYHWLIEYLGKAHLIAGEVALRNVPLIVDADMPATEFESLSLVLPGWPVVPISRSTLLSVDRLYIPSVGTYLPDTLDEPRWKGGAVCFDMLAFLRERVMSGLGLSTDTPHPRRIVFLARRSGRNFTNAAEVEDVARRFGAEIVDPAVLSFADQVRLFHGAELLIGAMGASFTNLIFCRPGTQAIALSSPYTQNFCVQANMALFAGVRYLIVAGEHPLYKDGDEETNRDVNLYLDSYSVDPRKLAAALSAWHAERPGSQERGSAPIHAVQPLLNGSP